MVYSYNKTRDVQTFSINAFKFVSDLNGLVYLHCELLVCLRNSQNSRCHRGCDPSRRRRRDTSFDDTSQMYQLSTGPLRRAEDNVPKNNGNDGKQKGTKINDFL